MCFDGHAFSCVLGDASHEFDLRFLRNTPCQHNTSKMWLGPFRDLDQVCIRHVDVYANIAFLSELESFRTPSYPVEGSCSLHSMILTTPKS
jgi:hypothetical protein